MSKEGEQVERLLRRLRLEWNESIEGTWPAIDAMDEAAEAIKRLTAERDATLLAMRTLVHSIDEMVNTLDIGDIDQAMARYNDAEQAVRLLAKDSHD